MEGLRASTANGGPGHRPSMHPYHPLGSRGAAKLLRPAPAQRISVDLMLQRVPCLVTVCSKDPALASFLASPWAGEPPALLGMPLPLVNISRLSRAQLFPSF